MLLQGIVLIGVGERMGIIKRRRLAGGSVTASCSGYELNCVVGGPPVRRLEQRLCETGGKEHFIASRSLMTVPVIVDRWMAQAIHPVQQHTQGIRQGHAMQEGGGKWFQIALSLGFQNARWATCRQTSDEVRLQQT